MSGTGIELRSAVREQIQQYLCGSLATRDASRQLSVQLAGVSAPTRLKAAD